MRKKILSVALVLCMVVGMIPTAFASIATDLGYTDEQVAMTITEDTVITEDQDGLVLVVNTAKVTVSSAKITIAIVVAPGAKDSQIIVADEADVNAIIILDTAELTVEEGASAASVTVAAPEVKAEIAGTVETVTVTADAEKAEVTVAETASVTAVEVAAPEAKTEIAGAVETVTVAETAVGAETTVAETAQVAQATIAAPEAKTEIAGAVETVTVDETAAGASTTVTSTGTVDSVAVAAPDTTTTVNGAVTTVDVADTATGTAITGTNAGTVEVTGSTDNATVTPSTPVSGGSTDDSTSTHKANPGIVAAPLAGTDDGEDAYDDLYDSYSVSVRDGKADNEFNVTVNADGLKEHTAGNGTEGYWVGIAIPVPTEDGVHYVYYKLTVNESGKVTACNKMGDGDVEDNAVPGTQLKEQGIDNANANKAYDTIYFDFDETEGADNSHKVVVVTSDKATEFETAMGEAIDAQDEEELDPQDEDPEDPPAAGEPAEPDAPTVDEVLADADYVLNIELDVTPYEEPVVDVEE